MIKALGDSNAELVAKLAATDARLAKIEAQPEPMPTLRVVTKSGDTAALQPGDVDVDPVALIGKLMERIGPDELQKIAMKHALSQPQRVTP